MGALQVFFDNGVSRNEGVDVGCYPLHDFTHNPEVETAFRVPLRVDFAGYDQWVAGCYRRRTCSELFAVEFVRQGSMRFTQEGRTSEVGPGSVFLVQPGKDNELATGAEGRCGKMTACLSGPVLPCLLSALGLDGVDQLRLGDAAGFEALLEALISVLRGGGADLQPRLSEAAYGLLLALGKEVCGDRYPPPLAKALAFMENSFRSRLALADLCRVANASASTLNRLFQRHFGVSPVEHLIRLRMEAARRLLRDERLSVKEVSLQLGYKDQLCFSAEFKRRHGSSPRAFRLTRP